MRACSICGDKHYALGWCKKHYRRWYKHGSPHVVLIKLGPGSLNTISQVDLAWLAGLLEGEGAFMFTAGRPGIVVRMTDKDVVERVAGFFDRTVSVLPPRDTHHQPQWGAAVHGQPALRWMEKLMPWMGQRRQAKIKEILVRCGVSSEGDQGEQVG